MPRQREPHECGAGCAASRYQLAHHGWRRLTLAEARQVLAGEAGGSAA